MKSLIAAIALLFVSQQSFAIPVAPYNALEKPSQGKQVDNSEYDFNGIVKLSNCSGSLIRFAGQPLSSQAYVLTNGHCINTGWGGGFLRPGEIRYNERSNRRFNVYNKVGRSIRVFAEQLVYATMTDTDSAIYQLRETYEELAAQAVDSLELSVDMPMIGTDINIVSGYWDTGFTCSIEHLVFQLKEGDWTFNDSIRYSAPGCKVYGGTSGSPVIEAATRQVIGVNNTGNESGRRCTMNNPCEIDPDGNVLIIRDRGYGQQTYLFYSCLSVDFRIDLSQPGCELPQ